MLQTPKAKRMIPAKDLLNCPVCGHNRMKKEHRDARPSCSAIMRLTQQLKDQNTARAKGTA
ncbi:hypothetical protein [Crenothrix polyspora]|uniref:Uncharacterized protein n=1 Tax=Crenothrix polyspora TaxID=360316 RepID=A0A1R4H190_9GAMM|nr:hypothetical protein [Crenothrix polyspora]SJM89991.1 hypothetical protein CRENPOLYSF1_1290013 [Crenothrix polyspora]